MCYPSQLDMVFHKGHLDGIREEVAVKVVIVFEVSNEAVGPLGITFPV